MKIIIISDNGNKVTYWGLGYKVIRYTSVSPYESFKSNRGVKFGSWFMKYEIEKDRENKIENEKNRVKISDVEIISKETVDTSTLVKFNGVLYAKSYALIDYAGDFNNTIGVIDKLIDKKYLPNLDGETNSEELLNAKVLEANEEKMDIF